jgi:hypothetical protein
LHQSFSYLYVENTIDDVFWSVYGRDLVYTGRDSTQR